MIDFRYHIVSLGAVLLALAVGVVLGAGPLRGELARTVDSQVQDLRTERAGLRSELDQAARREQNKDAVIAGTLPELIPGRLSDTRVAVVVFPGADGAVADQTTTTLSEAGAAIVSQTQLQASLEAPGEAAAHAQLADELAPSVAELQPREDTGPSISTVLAAVLVGADAPGQVGSAQAAGDRLQQEGLLQRTWADDEQDPVTPDRGPPEVVVLIAGGPDTPPPGVAPSATDTTQSLVQQRMDLVAALGETDLPVVVVASGTQSFTDPVEAAENSVVRAIRADGGLSDVVSTVDDAETAAGQLAVVLTVTEALTGNSGQYGLGADADGPIPEVPAPPATPSTPSAPGTGVDDSMPSTDPAWGTTGP